MGRILVIEDEVHIAEGVQFNLEAEGHEVEVIGDGLKADSRLGEREPPLDLVVLDVMLPGMNGYEIARRTRAAGNYVPILMLTAKDETEDRVRGLEEGADDYLSKPFRLEELLARVRGLLRRRKWEGSASDASARPEIQFGEVTVHFDRFEITSPSGTQRITTREAGLLRALIAREGEAVTRGDLLEDVWGLRPDTQTRVVDSFIVRLRRYVEVDPSHPRHIVSVRGHGYRFVR